jgi:hypothetical protein
MYKGFNLELRDAFFEDCNGKYSKIGSELFSAQKSNVRHILDNFKDSNGNLEASKITANWFPTLPADVFLSHSHDDEDLAINLAGWLKEKFGLSSFIDSCVWGYSDRLLKMIDKEFCYQPSSETYDYQMRNRSTAHVHMMLSVALANMLDACDCILFLNTPNSILPSEAINSPDQTGSPWIYAEIAMTRLIKSKKRSTLLEKRTAAFDSATDLNAIYNVDLRHLTKLTNRDLLSWKTQFRSLSATSPNYPLDVLYGLKG